MNTASEPHFLHCCMRTIRVIMVFALSWFFFSSSLNVSLNCKDTHFSLNRNTNNVQPSDKKIQLLGKHQIEDNAEKDHTLTVRRQNWLQCNTTYTSTRSTHVYIYTYYTDIIINIICTIIIADDFIPFVHNSHNDRTSPLRKQNQTKKTTAKKQEANISALYFCWWTVHNKPISIKFANIML